MKYPADGEITAIHQKINLLLQTGQLLMESGADTSRIIRNMNRTAAYMGIPQEKLTLHIMYTTLMVNIQDGPRFYTGFRKCQHHGINMTVISALSKLSWRAMQNKYSLEKFAAALEEISHRPRFYSPWVTAIGAGFACGGFCKLFGSDWLAFLYTAICASLGFGLRRLCQRWGFNAYAGIAIAAFGATCLAFLTQYLPASATPWHPLIACALFIVPGIPLINSIDDLLNNYIVSGSTRAMNTIIIVASMTFGIVIAIRLLHINDFTSLRIIPDSIYISHAAAAAISAVGFSMIFNVPRRLLPAAAAGGVLSVCLRNLFALEMGMDQAAASFIGSAAVGILSLRAIHWFHTPNHVLAIPAVIPMIPGVLLYRLLFAIININNSDTADLIAGFRSGIEAMLILAAIAVGIAIPNIFLSRYIERNRQLRQRELLAAHYSESDD